MQLVAERSQAITGADGAMVNLIDGDMLHTRAVSGIAGAVFDTRRPLESSVAKHAIESGLPLLIEDAPNDPRVNQELRAAVGDTSLICVPLFHGGEVIGTLNVLSRSETNRLNEGDRQTLEMLSVVLSAAVSQAAEFEARRGQAAGAGPVPRALRGRLDRDPASRPRRPGRRGEPCARADAGLHRRGVRRDDHARLHPPRGLPARRGAVPPTLMLGRARVVQARGALLAEGRRARLGTGERRRSSVIRTGDPPSP